MLKIAIPVENGELCMHFGHCQEFAVYETDESCKKIVRIEKLTPPPHETGSIPRWIASLGVKAVIAGGMGPMAQQILAENNIAVMTGIQGMAPEKLAEACLAGTLAAGAPSCSHGAEGGHGHDEHCHGHGCR